MTLPGEVKNGANYEASARGPVRAKKAAKSAGAAGVDYREDWRDTCGDAIG